MISLKWVLRRTVRTITVLYIVITINFILVRMLPGSPADYIIEQLRLQGIDIAEAYRMARIYLGFTPKGSLWEQYTEYLSSLFKGDLGYSYIRVGEPVSRILVLSLPWTMFILSLSLATSFTIGVCLGTYIGYRRGGLFDKIMSIYAPIASTFPNYLLAIMILYISAIAFPVFPFAGAYDPYIDPGFTLEFISSIFYHAALPVMTYTIIQSAGWMLTMKSSVISVLGEDYVECAKARGLTKRRVMLSYVGRNSILPLIARLAISVGMMMGGSIFIESMFSYPGIGYYLNASLLSKDYPIMQAIFLIMAMGVILSNFVADTLYFILDPRIRYE